MVQRAGQWAERSNPPLVPGRDQERWRPPIAVRAAGSYRIVLGTRCQVPHALGALALVRYRVHQTRLRSGLWRGLRALHTLGMLGQDLGGRGSWWVVARDGLGASVCEERCELARYPRRSWRDVFEEFREDGLELIAILRTFEMGRATAIFTSTPPDATTIGS